MFDLFRSRAKAVRYLLGALLMLVAISMVITLIPGFGTNVSSNDQIVAEVGKEPITVLEVQQSIQAQMRGRNLPAEMAAAFVPQYIDQLVTENALAYQAERMGYQVSKDDLGRTIESIFPQLFENGKFVGSKVYAAYLAQQNMTIPQFENNLRKQLLLNKLRSLVLEGTIVPLDEVEREYRRRNEKVKIEYAAVTPEKYRAEVKVAPETIQSYFNANRSQFTVPEKRSFQMLIIDQDKVGESISIPESALLQAYQAAQDQYRLPERVQVRHILLKTTDVPKEEIPKIRARAEDLLKQVRAGADFAELARKNSQDPGSAAKGGDLGWVLRGQTVKAFEETAFSLKPKEISNLVTTEYGFHILQVMAKEGARLRPFAEVRSELATERKRQLVYDRMQTLSDQARAALIKNPLSAAQIASDLGLQFVSVEKAGAGDPVPEVGVSQELQDALSSLPKGEVTPVVQIQPTKLAVAVVTDVFPARPAELVEVEARIRDTLIQQELAKLVDERSRELVEKAKSMNGDLKRAAQAVSGEWKAPPEFSRTGAAEGIGSASYLEQAFAGNEGDIFGPVTVGDRRFVCKIVTKVPADMTGFAAERDNLQQELKSRIARQRNDLFEEGLKNRLIAEGKIKIHRATISRIVSNYAGR
jgi:peptidyl-prolyl cis-trans isomerase D